VADSVYEIRWTRPVDRVTVAQGTCVTSRMPVEVLTATSPAAEAYDPWAEADLLPRLLELGPHADGYARFAETYGFLGLRDVPETNLGNVKRRWERAVGWEAAIRELQVAVELQSCLEQTDTVSLKQRLYFRRGRCFLRREYGYSRLSRRMSVGEVRAPILGVGFYGAPRPGEPPLDKGDVVRGAALVLEKMFSWRLGEELGLLLRLNQGSPQIRAGSRSLIGVVWLQLAERIAQGRAPRPCARCGRIFVISPRSKRGHGSYCSPACRQAVQRLRTEARRMDRDNVPLRSIARRLSQKTSTVRAWLDESKRRQAKRSSAAPRT